MIKAETMNRGTDNEGVSVSVSGDAKDLLFEAMSALEGIRRLFDGREHAEEYKEIGCGILRGELDNDAWKDKLYPIMKEEFSAASIVKELASGELSENGRKFLKGFMEWLGSKIDGNEEDTLEC